jgi:hypothetical protein
MVSQRKLRHRHVFKIWYKLNRLWYERCESLRKDGFVEIFYPTVVITP